MKLISSAYEDNGTIPLKYAHPRMPGGQNISIPLQWEGAPEGTRSFAIIMIDVSADDWVHWLVIDIPPDIMSLPEGASGTGMPPGARELNTTFGSPGYGGPKPPPGTGVHKYVTTLYALSAEKLDLSGQPSNREFVRTTEGKALAQATLTGTLSQ